MSNDSPDISNDTAILGVIVAVIAVPFLLLFAIWPQNNTHQLNSAGNEDQTIQGSPQPDDGKPPQFYSTQAVINERTESRVTDHEQQIDIWLVFMITKHDLDIEKPVEFVMGILNVSLRASTMPFTSCRDWLDDIVFALEIRKYTNKSPSEAAGEVTAKYFPGWYSGQCGTAFLEDFTIR